MKYLEEFKTAFEENGMENAFNCLKRLGARRTEVIWILVQYYGYTIPEADNLVLNSTAWKEDYEATLLLREEIYAALEDEGQNGGKEEI